jgi:uncharacterized protein involved in type VI secretion and phage assembly
LSLDRFQNLVRAEAQRATVSRAPVRIGIVTNYVPGPPYPTVKVALQPDGTLTGYLPVTAQWVGNGWGMFGAPNIGDQCEVQFQEDGASGGFVVGRFWNVNVQGMPVPSGEWWLIHQTGASLKFTNDGKVTAKDSSGSIVIMNGDGTGSVTFASGYTINANTKIVGTLEVTEAVTMDATLNVADNIATNADISTASLSSINSHIHGGVLSGGATTGGPQG